MADIRIRETRELGGTGHKLKKVSFEQRSKDGTWKMQEREVYDHGNAAAALLYNKEKGTVILTRQFRLPTYLNGNPSGMLLEACAGLIDEGENPDETIKREIREETGYSVDNIRKVVEAYSSAGSLTELLNLYIAEYKPHQKTSEGGGLEQEGEEIIVVEMPYREALDLLEKGEIRDMKTVVLIQYLQLHRLL